MIELKVAICWCTAIVTSVLLKRIFVIDLNTLIKPSFGQPGCEGCNVGIPRKIFKYII